MMKQSNDRIEYNGFNVWPYIIGIIGFLVVLAVISSVVVVNAGYVGILTQFGEVKDVFQPGIHFRIPLITDVIMLNTQTMKYEVDASAASEDLQTVTTKIVVNYRVHGSNEAAKSIYTQFRGDVESRIIAPLVQENVKAATAKFTASDLIQRREVVKSLISANLKEKLLIYGLDVEEVSITNFDFSPEFNKAIEEKVVVEQQRQRAQLELEQKKIDVQKLVVEQNATAQAQIIQADAQAKSVVLKAQGDATATLLKAEAQQKAIQLVNSALSPAYTQYIYATQWDGKLPYFMGNTPGVFLNTPMNVSG